MWGSLLAFVVILGIGGGWYLIRRRKLLSLFKVTKDHGITIFLSRLQIVIGGAVDFNGHPHAFSGAAVTANEASAASA